MARNQGYPGNSQPFFELDSQPEVAMVYRIKRAPEYQMHRRLCPHMTVAKDDVFLGGKPLQTNGPPGMDLVR